MLRPDIESTRVFIILALVFKYENNIFSTHYVPGMVPHAYINIYVYMYIYL